ncbi:hypothetical protein GF354_06055 [Candidatus Peregrinibacteria bacterium]|nr:hypothetical protein [Candidatus Peregrinibacteria bacterium]
MNIQLSWDLFIMVFFVVIVAYSFIIGRDNTLKVILGTYVAAIAADASGNLVGEYLGGSALFMKLLQLASVGSEQEAVIFVKVMIFVSLVILYAVRGAFRVSTVDDRSAPIRIMLLILYSVMSAGLIISCILVFVSGVSLIGGGGDLTGTALWSMYSKSRIIRFLLTNSYILFSLPALSFLIHSLYTRE